VQGLSELVEFDDSYLTVPELAQVVASADVVLLPYDSVDQVTSGVLIEAIAAARPVVSTSFPHARELLEDGAGTVIPQQDSAAIAVALRAILTSKDVAARMIQRSQAKAGDLLWPAVGAQYRGLALTLLGDRVSIPA
jgi:glycosyltransferase involved in cell wall biosynthesis